MAQKTEGIQQLLIAEKKASERVAEARKRKNLKLKNAKKEADSEIQRFKAEKEREYKEYEQAILGKKSDSEAQVQGQTLQKTRELDSMMKHNKAKALKAIQSVLFDINIQLHENVKL